VVIVTFPFSALIFNFTGFLCGLGAREDFRKLPSEVMAIRFVFV
jgi:hypothetical protein